MAQYFSTSSIDLINNDGMNCTYSSLYGSTVVARRQMCYQDHVYPMVQVVISLSLVSMWYTQPQTYICKYLHCYSEVPTRVLIALAWFLKFQKCHSQLSKHHRRASSVFQFCHITYLLYQVYNALQYSVLPEWIYPIKNCAPALTNYGRGLWDQLTFNLNSKIYYAQKKCLVDKLIACS